jgi:SAM-dependent methyltransferase
MCSEIAPAYLQPYLTAARRHGENFASLLWASPETQAARFDAISRLCHIDGKSILDVGCGRADLLDFLLAHNIAPDHYTGLEAVEALANAAERKKSKNCLIVRADFVAEPARLLTAADVIVFSGSLNTLESHAFYSALRTAHAAAVEAVAFNFLCSPRLAGAAYLHWHRPDAVRQFAEELGGEVESLDDYLEGDCTICIRKTEHA